MKTKIIGLAILLLSASIIYSSTLISASIYSQVLTEIGWNGQSGIFDTALEEIRSTPLLITISLVIAGVVLIFLPTKNK